MLCKGVGTKQGARAAAAPCALPALGTQNVPVAGTGLGEGGTGVCRLAG